MESIIKDKVTQFLQENEMISRHQHGYMAGRLCLTNLLECWTKALDDGCGIDVLYLDYRKAFDSVSHKKLLDKLKLSGINGKLLQWLESFLTGRSLRVGVRGSFSKWLNVLSGVPQGSILGPLLFLIFVNEIPRWIVNDMKMFADDTKLWTRISSPEDSESLQLDLDSLAAWSNEWQLYFNPEKCKVMHIGNPYDTKHYIHEEGTRVEV